MSQYTPQHYQHDQDGQTGYSQYQEPTLDDLLDKQVTRTTNLPLNDHMQKLEVLLAEIVSDLENSKKDMQIMRGDLLNIGYLEAENNQGISQLIQDEAIRVGKNFKKQQDELFRDHKNFIDQIKSIREDRKDLTKKVKLVEHRVNETESNVGFKQAYATVYKDDYYEQKIEQEQQEYDYQQQQYLQQQQQYQY